MDGEGFKGGHLTGPQGELTLWQMLIWTYQQQKAHRYLRNDFDWFRYAFDSSDFADVDDPRPTVHADAAAIHAAVTALGFEAAACIVHYAVLGTPPDPFDMIPEPGPVPADRHIDRYGRGMFRGKLVDYRLEVLERWTEKHPVHIRNRKSTRIAGYKTVLVEVEFCPIEWTPDPAWVLAVNGVFETWCRHMEVLEHTVAEITFRSHKIRAEEMAT